MMEHFSQTRSHTSPIYLGGEEEEGDPPLHFAEANDLWTFKASQERRSIIQAQESEAPALQAWASSLGTLGLSFPIC